MNHLLPKKALLLCSLIIAGSTIFSSCSNQQQKNFSVLTESKTKIDFENIPVAHDRLNILYYIYYYNGGGVGTGDINNDGLVDIYFTANNKGQNKLFLNKGNLEFEDVTGQAGVAGTADWCTGVTMADINADGFLDIYVCAVSKKHDLKGRNELFINKGNGTFTESAAQYGLDFSGYSTQAAFFDYDHDGDLDCYLMNQSDRPYQYIVDTSNRRKFDPNAGDRFYRNDLNTAAKKFTDVSRSAGIYQSSQGYGLGLAVADINNDGWDDVYVGNDFHENDYYYVNNGNGTFTESGAKVFNHYSRFSMGNDVADYNNDGDLDVLTVDMLPPDEKTMKTYGSDERVDIYNFKIAGNGYQPQVSRNCLQRNNGNGQSFSDIGLAAGISATDWSWTPLMIDFDNDGYKDIFISSGIVKRPVDLDYVRFVSDLSRQKQFNSSKNLDQQALEKMPEGSSYCFLYKGNGTGNFEDKSEDWGVGHKKGFYTGAAYADFDNDGDLDIAVNPINSKAFIYQNNTPTKDHLQIQFKGDSLNSFGVGAKVYLFQKDRTQFQHLMLTRGFQSSSPPLLHFGLDTLEVDSLLAIWPTGEFQWIKKVEANKLLTINKKDAGGKFDYANYLQQRGSPVIELNSLLNKEWKHKEDQFDDFTVQYLIPHMLSKRGPKLAVADVNKDGLDDFYVGGAIGQAGQLFIQNSEGKFSIADTAIFSKDANCEDVDAVFFDANKDGALDLLVASGGNFYKGSNPFLLDRLYLNDGKGHFVKAENSLPPLFANKSCVSVGDLNGDGNDDIFVGVLAAPDAYGVPQTSFALLNDGKGSFRVADEGLINLKNVGMVTSSSITDVNHDGKNDLIVAGEWMTVSIFLNKGNRFEANQIPNASGLWQGLQVCDVNHDGHPDILAGNWGLNSKLASGKNGPLKMYIKDFDYNGKAEPILAYTINGREYPFMPKDEIEQVLPGIKKNFLYYADYAGKTMEQIFEIEAKDVIRLEVDDLASAVFYNDGKGNFKRVDFPMDLQLSPIFSFQQIKNTNTYFAGGNFMGVLPYEGAYDASALVTYSMPGSKMEDSTITGLRVINNKGQVTDLKWIRTAKNGEVLIAARNNDGLLFYQLSEQK